MLSLAPINVDPSALVSDYPSLEQESFSESAPTFRSDEDPGPSQINPSYPNEDLIPPPLVSLPDVSAQRFPAVTVEDWPEHEDELFDPEFDGLQIPEEDAFRDHEDLYACAHDDKDDSEAAQQFSDLSDPDFLEFLRRELGDLIDEDIQSVCE